MNPIQPKHKSRFSGASAFIKETLIAVLTTLLLVVFPETVHASLFSFVDSLISPAAFAQESTATSPLAADSETMPILGEGMAECSDDQGGVPVSDEAIQPSVGPAGGLADIDACPSNTAISTYVVQPGDTLSGIADMFDVSVNTVVWANGLSSRTIQPGQTLVILPVSGISYTIKSGDTLQALAGKYTSATGDQVAEVVNDILLYNNLSSPSDIRSGETIIIPDGELGATAPSASAPAASGSSASSAESYEPVIPGDGGPSLPGPNAGGYYACPVYGAWLSQGLHGHNAVDLAVGIGNPIYAAANGTVIVAKDDGAWNGGYGNYVVISHPNGTETLYAHAEKVLVHAGEQVDAGDEVALVGITGETTGPHLHFEVRGAANPFVNLSAVDDCKVAP